MKIKMTSLASNLHYCKALQIATIDIWFGGDRPETQTVDINFGIGPVDQVLDIDDDWVFTLNGSALTAGKESGFLFLSPAGFEGLKPVLKSIFENKEKLKNKIFRPRGTWEDYEKAQLEFFVEVESKTKKKLENLEKKAKNLKDALNRYFVTE